MSELQEKDGKGSEQSTVSEVWAEDREGSLMSCEDFDQAQLDGTVAFYYRWGVATIHIVGCRKHVQQVMAALNRVQGEKKE